MKAFINLWRVGETMKADIRYGTTIHHDSTISKTEVWICDSEEEFWNQYDLIMENKSKKYTISAEVDVFSISRTEWIKVSQYREEVKING
jgi:hypothetical protein|tara:strand:- start:563 stop:832 length:270 start_codon:yes stop_codon:yes gene_type:complete